MDGRRPTLTTTLPLALALAAWVPVAFSGTSTLRERFDQIRPGMTKQQVYDRIGSPSPITYEAYGWETRAVVRWIEGGNSVRREFGPPWKVAWLHPSQPCDCWVSRQNVGWVKYDDNGLVAETIWYDRNLRPFTHWVWNRLQVLF
jgi:hypothetical protein